MDYYLTPQWATLPFGSRDRTASLRATVTIHSRRGSLRPHGLGGPIGRTPADCAETAHRPHLVGTAMLSDDSGNTSQSPGVDGKTEKMWFIQKM